MLAVLAVLALTLALSAACAAPVATPAPPTKTPKPTFTLTPAWTPTPQVFPTATPIPPTATPEATATPAPTEIPPTATPIPVPRLTANQNVNVRRGPGTNHQVIGSLSGGQSAEVTGKNPAGSWLQFDYNGQMAWVIADLVTLSGDTGSIQVAQNIPTPPPPPPTARPQPTAVPPPVATAAPQYPFQLVKGVERCEPHADQTYFNGFVRYRNNNPRNSVCVHIAYYGPRVTKCSGCDGVGDGVWGFSPFGGPAPKGTTVEIYVVSCPASIPAGGQTLQSGFGDLTPRSEKWVNTINESVKCTGITFVGD